MFRVVSLTPRRLVGLLLGPALLTSPLVGLAGAAPSTGAAKISAHQTETRFTSSQAKSVKLFYTFSKPSKSYSYRLSVRKGKKWQLVKGVTKVKTKSKFRGQRKATVKKLFANEPVRIGRYRLKLSIARSSKLLGFSVVKIVPNVSAGDYHSCALLSSRTVKCWGRNDFGQIGDGTLEDKAAPVRVSGIKNAIQLSAGGDHTCAVFSSGTVKCWGNDYFGALGDGTTTNRSTPVRVIGISNATQVSAGAGHSCAVKSDGTVKCWGANWDGQLGNGTTTDSPTPVTVSGISNATQVSAGNSHTCAVLSNGTVRCWGSNFDGELGDGTTLDTTPRTTPVQVKAISNAIQVSVSKGSESNMWAPYGQHTCAVLFNRAIKCWGHNGLGELAAPWDRFFRTGTPSVVSEITSATLVSAGGSYNCALLSGGSLKCWGANGALQLGDGVTNHGTRIEGVDFSTIPVEVLRIKTGIRMDAGDFHACAVLATGSIRCWGANWYGQLGNGEVGRSKTPVRVVGIP
jgi:alpha-tubulin suppressor-like RCC1 family protein